MRAVPFTTSPRSMKEAVARSGLYRLLARLWLREVDRDLARELRSPPLCDAFVEAGGTLPVDDREQTLEELAIDFCQLLLGPTNHLPPYQSVWETGQFQGATTASMKQFIDVVGYDLRVLPKGMMLDHLGVQLDLMGHLLRQCAIGQSEPEDLNSLSELAHAFFTSHLQWPTDLLDVAARRATTEFYRSVVLLTHRFLKSEM